MNKQHCNIAIQLLPLYETIPSAYSIIDLVINKIKASGFQYIVCPFETVIEGPYNEIIQLINEIQDEILHTHTIDFIINLKIQRSNTRMVSIDEKIEPHQ